MKDKLSSDNQIYEVRKMRLNSPIVFAGFVGAGLVGPLSVGYMIDKLGMEEIAYLRSKHLPPSTVARTTETPIPFILKQGRYNLCCNM